MSDSFESDVIHRRLDTTAGEPDVEVAKAIADIEGTDPMEMPAVYGCADSILDNLFSDPPSSEAEMEVRFTYRSYRITVEQDGRATFVKRSDRGT